MKLDDETIRNAVAVTMAAKIIEGIKDEHRDAILRGSIESALKDWEFKNAVQKEVAEKARQVASELLNTKEWADRIAFAVEEGLQRYIKQIPVAVEKTLIEALNGKESDRGYGSSAGLIMKHMANVRDEK